MVPSQATMVTSSRLRIAGVLGKLLLWSALAVGALSVAGCQVDDPNADPTEEQSVEGTQQIDQASVALDVGASAPSSPAGATRSPRGALAASPLTLSAPDAAIAGPAAGTGNGADPKSNNNDSATSRNGTTQMDPEPCPWSQKNGSNP